MNMYWLASAIYDSLCILFTKDKHPQSCDYFSFDYEGKEYSISKCNYLKATRVESNPRFSPVNLNTDTISKGNKKDWKLSNYSKECYLWIVTTLALGSQLSATGEVSGCLVLPVATAEDSQALSQGTRFQ